MNKIKIIQTTVIQFILSDFCFLSYYHITHHLLILQLNLRIFINCSWPFRHLLYLLPCAHISNQTTTPITPKLQLQQPPLPPPKPPPRSLDGFHQPPSLLAGLTFPPLILLLLILTFLPLVWMVRFFHWWLRARLHYDARGTASCMSISVVNCTICFPL